MVNYFCRRLKISRRASLIGGFTLVLGLCFETLFIYFREPEIQEISHVGISIESPAVGHGCIFHVNGQPFLFTSMDKNIAIQALPMRNEWDNLLGQVALNEYQSVVGSDAEVVNSKIVRHSSLVGCFDGELDKLFVVEALIELEEHENQLDLGPIEVLTRRRLSNLQTILSERRDLLVEELSNHFNVNELRVTGSWLHQSKSDLIAQSQVKFSLMSETPYHNHNDVGQLARWASYVYFGLVSVFLVSAYSQRRNWERSS